MPLNLRVPVRYLAENSRGRDFVVGDLHGSSSLLEVALKDVSFNKKQDRLLSVGDLIDRGPDSFVLLELLKEPWFFACLGNHEEVLLRFTESRDISLANRWSAFGGSWFFTLSPCQQDDVAIQVRNSMSFAIETKAGGQSVGIVHADVPHGLHWNEFTQGVASNSDWQQSALWDRRRGQGQRTDSVEGIEILFSGHQIISQAKRVENVWMIDTGAYRSVEQRGVLTLVQLPDRIRSYR